MSKLSRALASPDIAKYVEKLRPFTAEGRDEALLDAALDLSFYDELYADKASPRTDSKRAAILEQLVKRQKKADRQFRAIDPDAPEIQIVQKVGNVYRRRLADLHHPRGGKSDQYAEGIRKWTDKHFPRLTGTSTKRGKAWRALFIAACGDPRVKVAGQIKLAQRRAKTRIGTR